MVQLEYSRENVNGPGVPGVALSANGDEKAKGIDETFGFLNDPVVGGEEFVLP